MAIILGVDPGSQITGYGIIRTENNKLYYIDSGCIHPAKREFSTRLLEIFNGISQLMQFYQPDEVAIEQVFLHNNVNSALKLGHARGVVLAAVANYNKKIFEYAPRAIKQAIVGYGAAHKKQLKYIVIKLLMLNKSPQADAADALAIAICHSHYQSARHYKLGRVDN